MRKMKENISKCFFFGHIERVDNDEIVKWRFQRGKLQKKCIEIIKENMRRACEVIKDIVRKIKRGGEERYE